MRSLSKTPYNLMFFLLKKVRPSEKMLRRLSKKDRPGLKIELPKREPTLLEKGRTAFSNGQYADALHFFSQALQLDPNNAWNWHGRGDALQLMGDSTGALQAYERACALQPQTALHWGGKANALRRLQRSAESDSARRRALELDQSIAWLFND